MATVANTTIKITDQASAALKQINIALTASVTGFQGLERALHQNTAALNRQRGAGRQVEQQQRKTNAVAKSGIGIFHGLTGKITALVAAYVSLQTAQKFMELTDQYIGNQARLNIMNDGLQTTDELYDKIYKSAQRSLAPLGEVASNVAQLGIVAKDAFANNDEIIGFVETFNKAATVGGASQSMKKNAMYQLSQAFGSGRLQGDELRSVRENAPLLWKAIEKELGQSFGEDADFKKIAADGLISPDVIKRAAFASREEIDKAFKNMPFSFGDYFTQAKSKIIKSMDPIFKQVTAIINSPAVKQGINTTINYIIMGLHVVWNVIKRVGQLVLWFGKNWETIKPYVIGFGVAIGIVTGIIWLYRAEVVATAVVTGIITAATWLWNTAQGIINGQLVMTTILTAGIPLLITSIIVAVLALAAIVIWQLDNVMGAIYAASAFLWNLGIGIYNGFLSLLDMFIDPVIGLIDWFYTAWTGGFDGIGGACLNILGKIVSNALGVVKPILEIWDWVTGMNAAGAVEAAQKAADNWGKNKEGKKKTLDRGWLKNTIGADENLRLGYGDMFATGKEKGAADQAWMKNSVTGLWDSAKGYLGKEFGDGIGTQEELNKKYGLTGDRGDNPYDKMIADNTKETAKNTAKQEDDYKILRDVMAQRAVSRLGSSGGTVKVDMVNNNSLSSKLDIKGFLEALANTMQEAASTAAQGLHS